MWRLLLLTMLLGLLRPPALPADSLVLLFTNDVHGRLEPRDLLGEAQAGGAPALAEILAEERAALAPDQDLLLVDSGDFLLGSLRDLAHRGAPAIQVMNQLGYQAAALGNHEFDLGWGTLRLRARQADFPLLAANLSRGSRRHPPRGIQPSCLLVLPRTGRRVGLVGLTPAEGEQGPTRSRNPGLTSGPLAPALRRELDRLKGQGAELIVVLSHQGLPGDLDLVREAGEGVDVLVGGHYPSNRVDRRHRGTRILQTLPEGAEVGRLQIPFGPKGPDLRRSRVRWLPWASRRAPRNALNELLESFATPRRALGENPSRWSFRETCGWVLDSMLEGARSRGLEPDMALINRGALRASLPRGPITPRALFRIAPYENHLVHLELSGRRLERFLREVEEGSGRGRVLWRGKLPTRGGRVSLVLNDYLAAGGDDFELFRRARNPQVLPDTVQDCLRLSLQNRARPLAPPEPLPPWMLRRGRPPSSEEATPGGGGSARGPEAPGPGPQAPEAPAGSLTPESPGEAPPERSSP